MDTIKRNPLVSVKAALWILFISYLIFPLRPLVLSTPNVPNTPAKSNPLSTDTNIKNGSNSGSSSDNRSGSNSSGNGTNSSSNEIQNHAAPIATGKVNESECKLLGEFGIWVQLALAILCFSTLLIKRYREVPRRAWSVFFLDSSKQLTGASTIHILNLACASLLSFTINGDPCNWYWINIVIDCTLGVFFLYFYLQQLKRLKIEGTNDFGFYGDPPEFCIWFKQMLIWQIVVISMKFTMVVFMVIAHLPLKCVAGITLMIFDEHPRVKLVVVMIITPVVLNTLQLWLTDNFIKKQSSKREERPRNWRPTSAEGKQTLNWVIGNDRSGSSSGNSSSSSNGKSCSKSSSSSSNFSFSDSIDMEDERPRM